MFTLTSESLDVVVTTPLLSLEWSLGVVYEAPALGGRTRVRPTATAGPPSLAVAVGRPEPRIPVGPAPTGRAMLTPAPFVLPLTQMYRYCESRWVDAAAAEACRLKARNSSSLA